MTDTARQPPTAADIDAAATSQAAMPFKAEVSRLLDIVVHSLYSDKEIFLRELIANASDACDKLRYAALTQSHLLTGDSDFKITITPDAKARTLTVADNGIGMSREELTDNLGTIARSGTTAFLEQLATAKDAKPDVNLIGKFGVGFYAAFIVADRVEVKSRKAGSEESWCWASDGKGEFTVTPGDKATRGTEVVIHLKTGEHEFLEAERLRHIVGKYADHIAIPVTLAGEDKPANRAGALWLRPKAEITAEQYKEFYHHTAHAFDEPALTVHWRAEGKLEYTGLLFVPGTKPFDLFDPKRRHGVKLYVKRVFITDEAEGLVPPWLRFLRGVVDSEDLPLNVSREMLQNNPMLGHIRKGITRRVLSDLVKFAGGAAEPYAKFWTNFGPVLKEGLYEEAESRPELLKLLRCASSTSEQPVSLDDYISRMKEGQASIYYICGESVERLQRNPHLEGFRAKGVEVLLLTDTVDDFWPAAVGEYQDKKFVSVTRAGADLGKIAGADAEADETPKETPKELAVLIDLLKTTLGDAVKDVRASANLTDSPVCLTADEGDLDIHLERFLKQHNQIKLPSKRILELNPQHPVIAKMTDKAGDQNATDDLTDAGWLLFDQARLADGESLSDPAGFGQRLARLLAKGLA